MGENFRSFEAGPDPFGRKWRVEFRWLQNAITIRHSDSVDVKFVLFEDGGAEGREKVVALMHPSLLRLCAETKRTLSDPLCMKLAGLHLRRVIETEEDFEKAIVTPTYDELASYARQL
ncbi:MAG: hypothetical protein NTY38_04415 [Acidobacteria bacterium]|nr:hypothetical protein [Acidobacteriota bacterium]